mmetsp:Transcript_36522/g.46037  ORF Transcript_36522/g.46037 Transcript_36522/m.46037 type:complete len:225 (+) Transcript_36522:1674-2348(+)
MVVSGLQSGIFVPSIVRNHSSNFTRSSNSRRPPTVQHKEYKNSLSNPASISPCRGPVLLSIRPWRSNDMLETKPTREIFMTWEVFLFMKSMHCPTSTGVFSPKNFLKSVERISCCASGCFNTQASTNGAQSKSVSLTKIIPARETVAGEAFTKVSTSNISFTLSVMGIRSPFAKVRILLSSSTVFKSSIQIASTGPSKMTHCKSEDVSRAHMRTIPAKTPSCHS